MPPSTAKPRNRTGKAQACSCGVEVELRELLEIEGAGGRVNGEDADEDERAAKEGIERQLHRAVFLVGRSPDRDQEIFRHDDQLVENEEKEEIGAEEDAVGTGHDQEQPEEEFVRPGLRPSRKKERRRPRSAR